MILTHKQEVLEHIGETSSTIYDKAYQQGRAYAEAEHNAMCDSCIHKVSKADIEQIRNDAIDEYVSILKKELDFCEKHGDLVVKLAEQLKEQKNEMC